MKPNYQKTDKVTITKIGHFQGLQGEVLSSNEVGAKVLIDGTGLDWFFTFNEIQGATVSKKEIVKPVSAESFEMKTGKRPYKKKDKTQPDKPKRKYTRKIK